MKILIVEDERSLAEDISRYLVGNGFVCELASSYSLGEQKLCGFAYDIVLLDVTLPDGNGLALLPLIKQLNPHTGVLIISAKGALDDKVAGLDLGADDYITKPFHLAELNSRIKALLRRRFFEGGELLEFNEISVDTSGNLVMVNGVPLELTKREFDLLVYLVVNKNALLSKESIAEHIWGDNIEMADSFDFIYTHIKNLRKKLVEMGAKDYIKTVYGLGYKWGEL